MGRIQLQKRRIQLPKPVTCSKELFTPVVPGQDHKTAATPCFRVYSSWSILL